MVTKGIYLFWDKKYEQVIYAGRFTGRKRIKDHFQPSTKHVQPINKYIQTHPDRIDSVIFCEFDDISDDDLNQLEIETIKLFKLNKNNFKDNFVFNFTDGGEGTTGYRHTEEDRQKMSEAKSGTHHSEKTRQKMSEERSGKNNPMYNRHHTEESRQKISENMPDLSGQNNPNAKYTLWDITKCIYNKEQLFRNGNDGKKPLRCFISKYNGKVLPIGTNLDFYTPELINDLINEFLEVN